MNLSRRLISPIRFFAFSFLLLTASFSLIRAAGEVDPTFNAAVQTPFVGSNTSTVKAITVQSDGKILVIGNFTSANNTGRTGITRFNADGSVDQTFIPPDFAAATGNGYLISAVSITAAAVQTDGKIVVSGVFDRVNGQARKNLVRLNSNGSLDTTFTLPYTAEEYISEVKIQSDGKIVYSGRLDVGSRNGLTRLNSDGSVDNNFYFNRLSRVDSFLIQPDGKFIINATNNNIEGVYRLNADGTRDGSFTAASGNRPVYKISLQPDGKVLLGGDFTTINGIQQGRIARLNTDGTLDASFNAGGAGANEAVRTINVLQNGQIVIAGTFSTVNGVSRVKIARLNSDGTLDAAFNYNPGIFSTVYAVAVTADGGVLVGSSDNSSNSIYLSQISKLNAAGSLNTNFKAAIYHVGTVKQILNQPDGKTLVVGYFYTANGVVKSGITRLNPDGGIDSSFNSTVSNAISAVALQPDGKILVAANKLYRLNSDGSVDSGFQPLTASGIYGIQIEEMIVMSDGKIIVGGNLQLSNSFVAVARLNSNGSIDTTFNQAVFTQLYPYYGKVTAVKIQRDGKIVIGGTFAALNNVSRGNIARLNADGTLDSSFNVVSGTNNQIQDLALQADGGIIIGGDFNTVNGVDNVYYLARLLPDLTLDGSFRPTPNGTVYAIEIQPDNKILIGGIFDAVGGAPRSKLARISSNGALDNVFTSTANDTVRDIYLQNDGKILVGGDFNLIGGIYRVGLARLLNSSTGRSVFDFDGDGKSDISVFRPSNGGWYLLQSQNGFTGLTFGLSTDKLVPADYDGDGKSDVAVFRNGVWYLQRSLLGFAGIAFGDGGDVPVPADYDGDGRAEIAVFRPSNGYWYVLNLTDNQFTATLFGIASDRPVPADYDGDGKTDIAVNRSGNWYIQRSQLGFTGILFGDGNDKTVQADYDGDDKTDVAVFRPANGTWYLQQSTAGFTGITFGLGTDIPVAADYDGDGKADLAVVRNGNWYLNRSSQGFTGVLFGTSTDLPIPNAFVR